MLRSHPATTKISRSAAASWISTRGASRAGAFTTWEWYWATLNYAGAAIAFLVAYVVLAIGSIMFGIGASLYARRHVASPSQTIGSIGDHAGGALTWFSNLEMEGGPLFGRPVYALKIFGSNRSLLEVRLSEAYLTSAIDGDRLDLEVSAEGDKGSEWVPLDQINLIPPGAPVRLAAKFNLPAGLEPSVFLQKWQHFYLNATDNGGTARHEFNQSSLATFFPGKVGPRVTKKTSSEPSGDRGAAA